MCPNLCWLLLSMWLKNVFTWNIITRWNCKIITTCMLVGNLKVCYCALDNPLVDVVIKSNCIETIPRINEEFLFYFHWENHLFNIQMFYVVNLHRFFSFIPIDKFLVIDNCKKIHSPLLHELINLSYVYLKFCTWLFCVWPWFKYSQNCFFVHALSFVTKKKRKLWKRSLFLVIFLQ